MTNTKTLISPFKILEIMPSDHEYRIMTINPKIAHIKGQIAMQQSKLTGNLFNKQQRLEAQAKIEQL
jgi:hypothetical protein